jgi:hypothetical protein
LPVGDSCTPAKLNNYLFLLIILSGPTLAAWSAVAHEGCSVRKMTRRPADGRAAGVGPHPVSIGRKIGRA